MAATTETQLANNFDHQMSLGSPVKKYAPYEFAEQQEHQQQEMENNSMPPAPARPVSSRPTRTQRASFSEELPTATTSRRPKTTHVSSGRRRWRSPPNVQSAAAKEDFSPEEIDVPIPASPKLRPTTHIYR